MAAVGDGAGDIEVIGAGDIAVDMGAGDIAVDIGDGTMGAGVLGAGDIALENGAGDIEVIGAGVGDGPKPKADPMH